MLARSRASADTICAASLRHPRVPFIDAHARTPYATLDGVQVRIARQSAHLDAVVAFYRDGLGLPEIARFEDHDGYTGVMLDLPGTSAHLEFTATEHIVRPLAHVEDLLVLYVGSRQEVDRLVAQSSASPVPSANPYWDRVGVTLSDPDGFRVVLVAGSWPD